ncbi:unnamed protein product [Cyclocybe aegerita]|uniref:Uncharacterized protein n=1 Tax=Cyclocybe aegerita TaxID=1973307 RepID=A0A8S0XEP4_CYCAE|nr:unnamed protein product [Cyclocybe aegerita]
MTGQTQSSTSQKSAFTDPTTLALANPSSSLPSPPASSPGSHSHDESLFDHTQPKSPLSEEFSPQQDVSMPSFASLSSPAGSPPLLDIPKSPSFSSLVARSTKRKSPVKPASRRHPLSQSSSSDSSTGSQLSVERQLTQSPVSGSEENGGPDASGEDDFLNPPGHLPISQPGSSQAPDMYAAELEWHSSVSQNDSNTVSQSPPQGPMLATLESFSQPPSQFESFPIHDHGSKPKVASAFPESPSSSPSLALSQPVPLASPTFAISTPQQRQNWYQAPPRRRHSSQSSGQSPKFEDPPNASPPKRDLAASRASRRASRPPKFKKVFRSGTLQITPAPRPITEELDTQHADHSDALLQDVLAVQYNTYDPWANSQTQDYMDSSQSQDLSYPPLQTQAPYHSQILSQF